MSPLVHTCIGVKGEPCQTLIPVGQKRCPKHTHKHKQIDYPRRNRVRQDTPQRAVYNTPQWRRCRTLVLDRDPFCVLCGAPATIADHYPVRLTTLLARGQDPYDPAACRGLCHQCSGHEDAPRRTHRATTA